MLQPKATVYSLVNIRAAYDLLTVCLDEDYTWPEAYNKARYTYGLNDREAEVMEKMFDRNHYMGPGAKDADF